MGFDVKGLAELRAKLTAMKERASDPEPGLMRAAMVPLRAAKDAIKSGGGSRGQWAPNQTGTPLLFKSGRLINSLTIGGPDSILDLHANEITVGTNVFYAQWMQEGTGIYGPTGEKIFPKSGKALAWGGPVKEGGHVVRSIKGSPARPFLYIDERQANLIRQVFSNYIVNGIPSKTDDS